MCLIQVTLASKAKGVLSTYLFVILFFAIFTFM